MELATHNHLENGPKAELASRTGCTSPPHHQRCKGVKRYQLALLLVHGSTPEFYNKHLGCPGPRASLAVAKATPPPALARDMRPGSPGPPELHKKPAASPGKRAPDSHMPPCPVWAFPKKIGSENKNKSPAAGQLRGAGLNYFFEYRPIGLQHFL